MPKFKTIMRSFGIKIFEASHKVNIYLKIHEEPDNWASNWNVENSPVIYNYYKDVEINQIIYALTKDFKAYVAGHKIETHRNLILPSEFQSEDLDFISRSF